MSPTAEAAACLRSEGIDDNDGGVIRVIRDKGLNDDDGGVGKIKGICNASEVSETTTEAAGDRQQAQVIYDNDGGVRGGR